MILFDSGSFAMFLQVGEGIKMQELPDMADWMVLSEIFVIYMFFCFLYD